MSGSNNTNNVSNSEGLNNMINGNTSPVLNREDLIKEKDSREAVLIKYDIEIE
jgi:hypothetical protein